MTRVGSFDRWDAKHPIIIRICSVERSTLQQNLPGTALYKKSFLSFAAVVAGALSMFFWRAKLVVRRPATARQPIHTAGAEVDKRNKKR
jgi:hypothetical protein